MTAPVIVKQWLRAQLLPLMNVQRCIFAPSSLAEAVREPDLAVHTWAGALIQVHLLDEPLRLPRAKRLLENATHVGVVTLFLLDAQLLPMHGERISPEQWYVPFQYLFHERIYSYEVRNDEIRLRPAYFQDRSRLEVEMRFTEPAQIQQIRHFRTHVSHHALKGNWLVADFETEASAQSPAFRKPRNSWFPPPGERPPRQKADAPPSNGPTQTRSLIETSYAMLGLAVNASREDVKLAFRKLAFELHPDVSDLPKHEAESRFKALSQAYEAIKSAWGE